VIPELRATLLLLTLPLAGCLREPPGDDGGQFGEESGAGCLGVDRVPLGDDEASPLGFAPRAVLDLAVDQTVPLAWADGAATDLGLAPDRDGEAVFVDYEWVTWGDAAAAEPALDPYCPDRVELPFVVGFATADGAFAESLSVVLGASTADLAEGAVSPAAYDGTFDPWTFAPEGATYDAVSGWIELQFGAEGASGRVTGQGEQVDGEVASAESFDVATFGAPPF
jgi:hypothetical protein